VSRLARWYIFKPKIPMWVNFGGPYNKKCWYILWSIGIFCRPFGIFWPFGSIVVIWYIFPHFGILYQEKSGNPDC
jgi:hypothetical protein